MSGHREFLSHGKTLTAVTVSTTFVGTTGMKIAPNHIIRIHGKHLMSRAQVTYRCTLIAAYQGVGGFGGGGQMHRILRYVMLYLL